jgi:YtfJ family uncharacterized protein
LILGKLITVFAATALCIAVNAESIAPGNPVPQLTIEDRGELILSGDDIVYQPWSSSAKPGKVHILQYLAATRGASKIYNEFTDILTEKFEKTDFHITTVLNLDDAMWGTNGFVVSEIESKKREFPGATLVLDADGDGRKAWKLAKKSAALAILDKDGQVLYFTEDPMSAENLEAMLALVKSQIGT